MLQREGVMQYSGQSRPRRGKGDMACINLVMTLDNIRASPAAIKLNRWFLKENPAPSHGESREDGRGKQSPPHHTSDLTSQSGDVKYMISIEIWFDELFRCGAQEDDAQFRKRVLNGIKGRLVESYRAGQKTRVA